MAVLERFYDSVRSETLAKKWESLRCTEIGRAARPRVISMRVRDDGTRYGLPGIDMEAAIGAVEALWGFFQHFYLNEI
jgi:hypothetical protein